MRVKAWPLVIVAGIVTLAFMLFLRNRKPSLSNQPELHQVTIMMPFIPQIQWAAYYAAKSNGYYVDEGLDVELQYSTKGSAGPIEQLVGGNVDFILTSEDAVTVARSRSQSVVAIYPIEPSNVFYIVSEKNKNIEKPSDLIGKTVGLISSASGAYTNLQALLSLSNIDPKSVEIVQAGTSVVPAFLEGKFDAATVHLSQKLLIEEQTTDLNVIKLNDFISIGRGHIVVTKDFAEKNPEVVRKFLSATKRGLEYAANNPESAVDIYVSFNPDAERDKKVSQELWHAFIDEFKYKESLPGQELQDGWQESQDVMFDAGLITQRVDVVGTFTNDFIPQ